MECGFNLPSVLNKIASLIYIYISLIEIKDMYMDIRKGIVKLILLCGAFFNTQDKIFPINKNQTKTNVSS